MITNELFMQSIRDLREAVGNLTELYLKDETLNDRFNVSTIFPKSVDEWLNDLNSFIHEFDEADERQKELKRVRMAHVSFKIGEGLKYGFSQGLSKEDVADAVAQAIQEIGDRSEQKSRCINAIRCN